MQWIITYCVSSPRCLILWTCACECERVLLVWYVQCTAMEIRTSKEKIDRNMWYSWLLEYSVMTISNVHIRNLQQVCIWFFHKKNWYIFYSILIILRHFFSRFDRNAFQIPRWWLYATPTFTSWNICIAHTRTHTSYSNIQCCLKRCDILFYDFIHDRYTRYRVRVERKNINYNNNNNAATNATTRYKLAIAFRMRTGIGVMRLS